MSTGSPTGGHHSDRPVKVALAAEEAAGVQALRMLADRGDEIVAVFTDTTSSAPGASVASTARAFGVPVRPATAVRDSATAEALQDQRTQLLLNVHSLHVVHADVLGAPTIGAFNLHPGPLPEYAGLNVPSWALYNGEGRHGVTLHRMVEAVDAGDIVFQERFPIAAKDSALTVMMSCVRRGLTLVRRLLDVCAADRAVGGEPQDLTRRRWFPAGPPEHGRLDWDRPARRVVDFVRACDWGPFPSPWGHPCSWWEERSVAILEAEATGRATDATPGTVVARQGTALLVAAADELVRVHRISVDGGSSQEPSTALPTDARLTLR